MDRLLSPKKISKSGKSMRSSENAHPSSARLFIFARLPDAGKVKTRLIPSAGKEGAARIYETLLRHTLDVARSSGLQFEVRLTGGAPEMFAGRFGDDLQVADQGSGDLGSRMAAVPAPCLIIGSDCPGLSAPILRLANEALSDRRAVLGPATDGGYYLIGLREPMPWLFADMEWSTSSVFDETLSRLKAREVDPAILPELTDIDTPEDLARWPGFQ